MRLLNNSRPRKPHLKDRLKLRSSNTQGISSSNSEGTKGSKLSLQVEAMVAGAELSAEEEISLVGKVQEDSRSLKAMEGIKAAVAESGKEETTETVNKTKVIRATAEGVEAVAPGEEAVVTEEAEAAMASLLGKVVIAVVEAPGAEVTSQAGQLSSPSIVVDTVSTSNALTNRNPSSENLRSKLSSLS